MQKLVEGINRVIESLEKLTLEEKTQLTVYGFLPRAREMIVKKLGHLRDAASKIDVPHNLRNYPAAKANKASADRNASKTHTNDLE